MCACLRMGAYSNKYGFHLLLCANGAGHPKIAVVFVGLNGLHSLNRRFALNLLCWNYAGMRVSLSI